MQALSGKLARTSVRDAGARPKAAGSDREAYLNYDEGDEGLDEEDGAWDDSALISAYERAIEDYQRAHGLAAGRGGKQQQGRKKAAPAAAAPAPTARDDPASAVKADGARARRTGPGEASPSGTKGAEGGDSGTTHRTPNKAGRAAAAASAAAQAQQQQPQHAATEQEYAAWWARAQASPGGYADGYGAQQPSPGAGVAAGAGPSGAAAWGASPWDAYGSAGWTGWGGGSPWAGGGGGYGPPPHHYPPPPPPHQYAPWGQYPGGHYGPPPPHHHAPYPHHPPPPPPSAYYGQWGYGGAWGERGPASQRGMPASSSERAFALSAAEGVLASGALKSKSDLANLLMAWYQAGYATGRFAAQHPDLAPDDNGDGIDGEEEEEGAGGDEEEE